jgi:hypothetical protein
MPRPFSLQSPLQQLPGRLAHDAHRLEDLNLNHASFSPLALIATSLMLLHTKLAPISPSSVVSRQSSDNFEIANCR